jgi:hypothetical protein
MMFEGLALLLLQQQYFCFVTFAMPLENMTVFLLDNYCFLGM